MYIERYEYIRRLGLAIRRTEITSESGEDEDEAFATAARMQVAAYEAARGS